jgi:hypothetical protein
VMDKTMVESQERTVFSSVSLHRIGGLVS